jgi:hypothetical protein
VIEAIGSYGALLSEQVATAGLPVAEPTPMGAVGRHRKGKDDATDAARSVLGVDVAKQRRPRADGP